MNKKICHISTVHPVRDDRILYKECISLQEKGYTVTLIACNPADIEIEGIDIIPLPSFRSRWQRFLLGSRFVVYFARHSGARLIHFHDPELMPACVLLAISGKKVIYDVHENISQQLRYKPWLKPAFLSWLVSTIVHGVEQFCCLFFKGIIAATEDIASRFSSRKTIIVRNLPLLSWSQENISLSRPAGKTRLIYAGGLTKIRGIREMVEAVGQLSEDVELCLVGSFDDAAYEAACRASNGWLKVRYKGQLPLKEVYHEISQADIGLALLYPAKNYLKSLPVKAFEYMLFGKPIIMSDFPYWQEVFGNCSLFTDPLKPEKIAEKIRILLYDSDLRNKLGENGKLLISQGLYWEAEREKMFDLYKKLYA